MRTIVAGGDQTAWLARRQPLLAAALGVAAAGILLPPAIGLLGPMGVWYRLALAYLLLIPAALLAVRTGWRELFAPSRRGLLQGVAAALALYGTSRTAYGLLARIPSLPEQVETVVSWKAEVATPLALALLVFIVAGEEIVRAAVTLPLAARLGPWLGSAVAGLLFAAMHLSLGMPLLLVAAFVFGTFWSALVIKTRSVVPALVSHLIWDLAVLFVAPFWRTGGP